MMSRKTVCNGSHRWTGTGLVLALIPGLIASLGCERDEAARTSPNATATAVVEGDEHAGHDHGATTSGHDAHGHDAHAHDHEGHADEVKLTPEAVRAGGVKVSIAQKAQLAATVTVPARVAYNAEAMAHVGSAVAGRIAELPLRIGGAARKGDVVAVVDSPELGEAQSDFLQKRTQAAVAAPAVEQARSAYDRAKTLYDKSQGISLSELQKREGELKTAEGAAMTAKASVTGAFNRLSLLGMTAADIKELEASGQLNPKAAVRAPIDGQVIERQATIGELVGPEDEQLLTLADLSTVWVLADVPEARLSEIAEGASAKVSVGSQSFEGKVSYVAPELDASTRTARVRIEVANPQMKVRPGMFGNAVISVGGSAAAAAVLAISDEAIQTVEGAPALFVPVEGEPNTFAKRVVWIGTPIGGMVPVIAGLKEGDQYVSAGSFILKAELGKAGAAHEH